MLDASHLALAYLLAEWVIRVAMIVFIPLRRPPEAARSWLLLVMFMPVPALILYRLIGRPRFPQWRHERFRHSIACRDAVAKALPAPASSASAVETLALHLGGFPACMGNRLRLMTEYDAAIEALVAEIGRAERHIHLQTYIFASDDTGREVTRALGAAVARGVTVRVLVDALGSRPWARQSMAMLRKAGVDAHLILPIRFASLRRARSDLRNHRKLSLFDGQLAFIGSQNIVDRDFKPGIVNDELVARIEGPVAAACEAVFASDWYLETEEELAVPAVPLPCGPAVLQAMPSGPDYGTPGYERLLVDLVHQAKHDVIIVSPYLIPDEALLTALKNAVARNVTVDLVVSNVVDQYLVGLAQRSYYDELLRSGVRIYRYRRKLLHAKSVTVDESVGIIGSSNADIRSFMLNAEISLIMHAGEQVGALKAIHRHYMGNSDPLDLAVWRARPGASRLWENLARLVSPLL
ncbi:cardiolipin synthase [Sphingobium sp. EM0848]|uniref:cardiolipin synthase n=1 Tax=Sphingobium sp. EM0848 TaxID=2743473 RepID=UPI00159C1833|nr:cardiolipin synthase [Sphingobium sp. EM0848]